MRPSNYLPRNLVGFNQLKTVWAQNAWLRWSFGNCYFRPDIIHWRCCCAICAYLFLQTPWLNWWVLSAARIREIRARKLLWWLTPNWTSTTSSKTSGDMERQQPWQVSAFRKNTAILANYVAFWCFSLSQMWSINRRFKEKNYAQLFIWPVLKFWQIPVLTNSDSDKFQFWQIPILTNSNSAKFQFWQIQILTNSNSDKFQFLQKVAKKRILTNSNSDKFCSSVALIVDQ